MHTDGMASAISGTVTTHGLSRGATHARRGRARRVPPCSACAGGGAEARLAVERHEDQPERVERRHEHARDDGEVRVRVPGDRRRVHGLDDRVLREEAGERRDSAQREAADQHRHVGDRHVLAQAAHVAHVLIVVHRDDRRARAEEEQRLEARVRHQVEDSARIVGHAERDRHVAELRQRRVRDDALDVVLDDAQDPEKQRAGRADHGDEAQCGVGELEQRAHPRDHEDAGRHHRRRVDQRGDRGRALHRVGQPHVQRNLRRLAHRADEQADADHRHQRPLRAAQQVDRRSGEIRPRRRTPAHSRACRNTHRRDRCRARSRSRRRG